MPPDTRPRQGKNTVNNRLTPKPGRPVVENDEYAAFTRRILRSYARLVATGDIEALTHMTGLADDVEATIRTAVLALRDFGYSWADIGHRLGVTRQAATSPARPATPTTIRGSAARCAPTATTTPPLCCSTPTRASCGAGSPPTCPAASPRSAA